MNNPVFKSLLIKYAKSTCLQVLASVLRQFDTLTEFALYDIEDNDDDHFDESGELFEEYNDSKYFSAAVSEVFDALAGHSGLTKLRLNHYVVEGQQYRKILKNGWESLASLLRRPSSNLMVLKLNGMLMDNLEAYILAAGLLVNSSLMEFDFSPTEMTKNGWDTIFAALKRSPCRLEKLRIRTLGTMQDDVLSSILNALLENCTLKSLSLGGDWYAPNAAVANRGALFQLLHTPVCALERLDLNNVGLNNDSIICLRNAIANNSRLREIRLVWNFDVTTDGWVNFLTFPSNSKLEKFSLGSNSINDEALDVFRIALTNNRRLKDLYLGSFRSVTTAGWNAFSSVLCNPNSSLEKLDLTSFEDIAMSFADALTSNKRLRELRIFCSTEMYDPFAHILCNRTSIMSTYNSNHILSELSLIYNGPKRPLPIELTSALQINQECSVSQAARLKIIKTHFSGSNINTTPLTVMELKVLPTAISWMGRECGISEISDLLFIFVRSLPSLCDTHSRCKKRKDVN